MTAIATDVQLRWMIGVDRKAVMAIELASFPIPWTEEQFRDVLKSCSTIGMVAERHGRVVGFMVYQLLPASLHVLNFAVHPNHRRHGVGATMVDKLAQKIALQGRQSVIAHLSESNLAAQLFFRSQGFICKAIERGMYSDTYEDEAEDAYVMVLERAEAAVCCDCCDDLECDE